MKAKACTKLNQHEVRKYIRAASTGNLKRVRALLNAGVDVNATYSNGATALILAAVKGHTRVVRYLLKRGADPSTIAHTVKRWGIQFQVDALGFAAERGHLEIVRLLIKARVNVNGSKVYNLDALSAAAVGGHTRVVRELLAAGHSMEGGAGLKALDMAIAEKKQQTALVLIKAGVTMAATDATNLLLSAAANGLPMVVKALLDSGVDPKSKNQCGQTALRGAEAIWKQDKLNNSLTQRIRNLFENREMSPFAQQP